MDKENKFVRFHALQSILLHVSFIVIWIGLVILFVIVGMVFGVAASAAGSSAAGGIAGIFGLLSFLIWIVFIVGYVGGLIMAAVKSYQGNMFKLPIIGNMAAKWTGN